MFLSLVSGSSGNATLISDGSTTLLVDCGISGKRLEQSMAAIGLCAADLSALLITHEHIDHIAGAGVISRRYDVPVYATPGTHSAMNLGKMKEQNIRLLPDEPFEIGNIGINYFPIPHDASQPVGYNFFINNEKYTLATDIGAMTETVFDNLLGSKAVILEANHDVDMLLSGSYPFSLKQRILSDHGHLSNEACADTAVRLLKSGVENIMLGHLSNENNTPEIAYHTVGNSLCAGGAKIGYDINLCVASRYEVTEFI